MAQQIMTSDGSRRPSACGVASVTALALLAWRAPLALGQVQPGMGRPAAPAVSHQAPSAWPIYQAARVQSGNYGTVPYQAGSQGSAYYSGRYASVTQGWQNPWYGAEYYNGLYRSGAYPSGEPALYPYNRSYLYPYNYQDSTPVPYYEVGSGAAMYPYSLQLPDNSPNQGFGFRESTPARADAFQRREATTPATDRATVNVVLPDPQAVVTFQGQRTAATGTVRSYQTPPLARGARYEYDVVASWQQNGAAIQERRTVEIAAGGSVLIDFTRPSARGL